jgi:hypothetical protein
MDFVAWLTVVAALALGMVLSPLLVRLHWARWGDLARQRWTRTYRWAYGLFAVAATAIWLMPRLGPAPWVVAFVVGLTLTGFTSWQNRDSVPQSARRDG